MILMNVSALETPAVLIDLDIMLSNIAQMQRHCDALGKAFRPHIKTHKIPEIAHMQLEAGAVGIACQKVSEAEVFADAGVEDIQIPYNIVGERKLDRLMGVNRVCRLTVSADDPAVIDGLEAAARRHNARLRVMVDLGTDIQRTGAPPERVVELARRIRDSQRLDFAGLLVYPSTVSNRPRIQAALTMLHDAGFAVDSVSGGGIGGAAQAADVPEVTELRVGTYIFNDVNTLNAGLCGIEDCAMRVRMTVVSRPDADRVILDGGSKTIAADRTDDGHGLIVEYPEARIYKLSEEHAHCDFSACSARPSIGDIVHVIPVHTCVVTNLHDRIYGVRGDYVEEIWEVAARGMVY
jgi:D-serine deaminase-like pyridoxal phosphate-dependent protein